MIIVIILPPILWQHFKYFRVIRHRGIMENQILSKQYSFVFGVLIGQSGQKLSSTGISARLIAAVWCLSAVVFASAYIGVLMSFLRFPKLSPVIDQLEELPENHFKWIVQRGTALESLFVKATTGVYKTIGDGLLESPESFVDARVEGIHRVAAGGYVYIEEKTLLESDIYEDYVRSGVCRLSIAKKEFFKVNFAFPLPIASPLKPFLNQKILQMVEAGLVNYWKNLYWPKWDSKCINEMKQKSGPQSLRLAHLQGAFLILALGCALAFLAFLIEHFYFLYHH
ncbi:glutamate receptor ionotropic, delta-2-like [Daphnia pulicaria]|uniref:glutamate receptor ionotropic, delta-2-like n=1 Tax=Daphnia pulicaria TaxID=35523 RepID=UPI001EE9E821|nr:glutamate receptor ionotropic, delta-2-like [Daphnia pulicaria]